MESLIEKYRNSDNNLINDKIGQNITEIKPLKRNSFFVNAKNIQLNENKKLKLINKNNSSTLFIQVNTKKRKSLMNNYDINKIIYIQKIFKNFLIKKNKNNLTYIFLQKIRKIILSKKFTQFKKNISKKKTASKKGTKRKKLSININIYNTNKVSINNTEATKAKENIPPYCRTTKHNKIMSYVNYKLSLNQANNITTTNNGNDDLNNIIKGTLPFSPKINSITFRRDVFLNKIKNKNSSKKFRNKNPKNRKIIDKIQFNTLICNDISNNNTLNNNLTQKNITINQNIFKNNYNNSSNFSKISKLHKKNLPLKSDYRESSFKNIKSSSKILNPINKILKNKNTKNRRSNQINTEINKMQKINTFFNTNENKTSKAMHSKIYENCLNKDKNNKNKIETKIPKTFLNQKKQKTKKELKQKKNNNKLKINNKPKTLDDINIKKKYFSLWKENVEKKIILKKFVKLSKYLNHINHYKKIMLIQNTIQNIIKKQKKENIYEFVLRIKKLIIINLMRKLKEYKIDNKDSNNIRFGMIRKAEGKIQDKINKLKIVFNKLDNNKNIINNNKSNKSNKCLYSLINCFEKWKNFILNFPKINQKIISFKPSNSKIESLNNPTNNNKIDNTSVNNNLNLNKMSPKIINVINVQNYNENNNYNYNFKCLPMKDIPFYEIKQRNSCNCINEHLNINNKIYHKKKLGNNLINNNYNCNNNIENMRNCFNKKFNNEDKQKFDTYDTSSIILPFQSNNSEIISLEKNNIFYEEHPEEKFGFKKLDKIQEKEINFSENLNIKNNNKLYVKKQNFEKKHIFFKNKTSNIKTAKNMIKSLNIQFDNKNQEIIKRDKNFANDNLKLNKIFSSQDFLTEYNYNKTENEEEKMNKSFNTELDSNLKDNFKITKLYFNNNSPF